MSYRLTFEDGYRALYKAITDSESDIAQFDEDLRLLKGIEFEIDSAGDETEIDLLGGSDEDKTAKAAVMKRIFNIDADSITVDKELYSRVLNEFDGILYCHRLANDELVERLCNKIAPAQQLLNQQRKSELELAIEEQMVYELLLPASFATRIAECRGKTEELAKIKGYFEQCGTSSDKTTLDMAQRLLPESVVDAIEKDEASSAAKWKLVRQWVLKSLRSPYVQTQVNAAFEAAGYNEQPFLNIKLPKQKTQRNAPVPLVDRGKLLQAFRERLGSVNAELGRFTYNTDLLQGSDSAMEAYYELIFEMERDPHNSTCRQLTLTDAEFVQTLVSAGIIPGDADIKNLDVALQVEEPDHGRVCSTFKYNSPNGSQYTLEQTPMEHGSVKLKLSANVMLSDPSKPPSEQEIADQFVHRLKTHLLMMAPLHERVIDPDRYLKTQRVVLTEEPVGVSFEALRTAFVKAGFSESNIQSKVISNLAAEVTDLSPNSPGMR